MYGVATLIAFPGIVRDPLMYDLGLCLIPISFVVMGILGGGMATLLKKSAGFDLRGRVFELIVVLATLWLVVISWGVVLGFFGDTSQCYGSLGAYPVSSIELDAHGILKFLNMTFIPNIAKGTTDPGVDCFDQ